MCNERVLQAISALAQTLPTLKEIGAYPVASLTPVVLDSYLSDMFTTALVERFPIGLRVVEDGGVASMVRWEFQEGGVVLDTYLADVFTTV